MKRYLSSFMAVLALTCPGGLFAAERVFCENNPTVCAPDTLAIRFGAVADRKSDIEVAKDQEFEARMAIDTVSDRVQGWQFGIKHDVTKLEILEATTSGADAFLQDPANMFFNATGLAFGAGQPPGLVSGVVLNILTGKVLPVGNNFAMVRAKYKVLTDLDPDTPTLLEFTETLAPKENSPPSAINLTIQSKTRKPASLTDGEVKGQRIVGPECDDYGIYFGVDSKAANASIGGNSFRIGMRNKEAALGFSLAVRINNASYTFVDKVLGKASDRLVELNVTDNNGIAHILPELKINAGTVDDPTKTVGSISLGSATGFTSTQNCGASPPGGAFFYTIDCAPPVPAGAKGFTVAYVGDVDGQGKTIPVTGVADPCPVNEILVVNFGAVETPFRRGDVNGDRKLNITDGVVCAQNIFNDRLKFFDCKDMLDANNDGNLDTADPIYILTWVFLNGPNPPAPFPNCGVEAPGDTTKLGCNQSNSCP